MLDTLKVYGGGGGRCSCWMMPVRVGGTGDWTVVDGGDDRLTLSA
jgi:hypothetical protein